MPSPPTKMKILSMLEKSAEKTNLNFCGSALFHMKTRDFLKYFVNGSLCKQFFVFNWPQTSSKLICLTIFVTQRPLTQFQLKIRATNMQKSAKICVT